MPLGANNATSVMAVVIGATSNSGGGCEASSALRRRQLAQLLYGLAAVLREAMRKATDKA
jgi:hypothetical protein